MSLKSTLNHLTRRLSPKVEKGVRAIPAVNRRIEAQYDGLMVDLEASLKPYRDDTVSHARLPDAGLERAAILHEMSELRDREQARWRDGFVSGAVYHGDDDHVDFLNQVYALTSQTNPLHADVWPSIAKYEAEIVAMTAAMLGAEQTSDAICGVVSSGGTESILLAMKTYRDRARIERGITQPEMIVPVTAHAAFDKAAQYFNIKPVRVPVDGDYRADVAAARTAINRNTVVIVGSAPCFPYGVIDPIAELSQLALDHAVGFHTDACLGGFLLPWTAELGYPVPPFDFRLPGVTSLSAEIFHSGPRIRQHYWRCVIW